jgi:hypothetical protein
LLVVAHPAIGAALETLLRIEDRYDVRRIHSLAQTRVLPDGWRPDAALVDGVLLKDGATATIGAPTLVLSGNAEDGQSLGRKVDDGRGWLRKESNVDELVSAIDRLIGRRSVSRDAGPGAARFLLLALAAIVLAAAIVYLIWLAVFQS